MMTTKKQPAVLSIAGSDPSGGAGIQGDIKTIQRLGGQALAVVAGLTAQNTFGVAGTHAVSPQFVADQLEALWSDAPPVAAKTGMLATAAIVEAVAEFLARHQPFDLVVDPVMVATSGARLLDADAVEAVRQKLCPLATLLTPNGPEAEVLSGIPIRTAEDMLRAGQVLLGLGPRAVLIKGGDLEVGDGSNVLDLLLTKESVAPLWTTRKRLEAGAHRSFHGSGCCLAAAAATALAFGHDVAQSARIGQAAVAAAIQAARATGRGAWPVNHSAIPDIDLLAQDLGATTP